MPSETVIKKAACFFCHNNCGVLVYVQNGKVVKVEGNPKHPASHGFICQRCASAPKWLYHPDQLKHALKRVGERGQGKWQQIPWEQALDEIAAKLNSIKEKYGPESLFASEGTYRSDHFWARSRFLNLFGNPQNLICPGTICFCNDYVIEMALLGSLVLDDIGKTNCVVLWGANPKQARLTRWKILKRRIDNKDRKEIKVIVIDPIISDTAAYADMCLQIRPGTDAALALGWIHVIIEEGLYDKAFVQKWTYGFKELAERVKEYSPQKVAEITGLSIGDIIESARTYADSPSACIDRGVASDQLGLNSTRVEQTRIILSAITGNIDVPGGDFMSGFPLEIDGKRLVSDSEFELSEMCTAETKAKQIGSDRFKLMSWSSWDIVSPYYLKQRGVPCPGIHYMIVPAPLVMRQIISEKPYPLKAMICAASNPVIWAANTPLVVEALSHPNIELSVVLEYWMTPTAQLADYVLPAASWLERPLCSTVEDWVTMAFAGERAIEPLGDRHEDYQFWRGLGIRLGQEEYWPWKDMEEVVKHRISPLGISYEEFIEQGVLLPASQEFRKFEKYGFATATGKVELYSTVFEKLGYDPLPYFEEPPESPLRSPELIEEFPLILNTGGRFMPQYHSEHRQFGMGLRESHPDPLVTIHPETAAKQNIRDGDWVYIETARGKIRQKAKLTELILPNVVNAEASWWFPEKPGEDPSLFGALESNANMLTIDDPDSLDPLTGGWCNRAMLCRIYRAEP